MTGLILKSTLLLLLTAVAAWLLRRQSAQWQWAISASGASKA